MLNDGELVAVSLAFTIYYLFFYLPVTIVCRHIQRWSWGPLYNTKQIIYSCTFMAFCMRYSHFIFQWHEYFVIDSSIWLYWFFNFRGRGTNDGAYMYINNIKRYQCLCIRCAFWQVMSIQWMWSSINCTCK